MSIIYKHKSGGELYQAGAKEIPDILRKKPISLLILSAEEYQPEHISNTGGSFEKIEVIYVPLKDSVFLSAKKLRDTVLKADKVSNIAVEHILSGNSVLSTCWAGLNRSGLISGLTMKKLSGAPGDKIVRQIRKLRSWRALSNPLFADVIANS